MFDSVMGVGKTPQITQDISTMPYSLPNDDVTGYLFPYRIVINGLNTTELGDFLNVLNPNFDYITNNPYQIIATAGTSTGTTIKTLDMGRLVFIRGLAMWWELAGAGSVWLYIDVSENGQQWTRIRTAINGNAPNESFTNLKFRYLRLTLDNQTDLPFTFTLFRIRLFMDSTQTFYK